MPDPIYVTRKIIIDPGSKKQDIAVALDRLKSLLGVETVVHHTHAKHIEVEYDVLRTCFSDIEDILLKKKIYPNSGIRNRILSLWYEYLDITARDNAYAPPPACCNKPPRRQR